MDKNVPQKKVGDQVKKEDVPDIAYSDDVKSPLSGSTLLGQSTTEINKNPNVLADTPSIDVKKELPTKEEAVKAPPSDTLPADQGASDSVVLENGDYKGKSIAQILKEKGKIKEEELTEIKNSLANKEGEEEDLIRNKGLVDETEILKAKASSYGVPFVDLANIDIPRDTLTKIPYESARAYETILFKEDSYAHIGMVDPLNIQGIKFIENIIRKPVKPYFALPGDVQLILDTRYGGKMESEVSQAIEQAEDDSVKIEESIQDITQVESTIANAPVARIVNMLLEYAAKFNASDIHVEPRENRLIIRFRIHGVMYERLQLPKHLNASIVARIKILSNLKIDEHRVPQDGRFQVKVGEKEIDLRVSVMPIVHGEKVVIRLLEKGKGLMRLEETGMRGSGYKIFKDALSNTQGVLLVTGPTGSGKTQTLASSLLILNKPDVNIVTLEDPVEIKVDGVNQIQINVDVGLTFAKGLRSVLRQDPDIVMVGEIRDEETADLAVQASLTGHLVLSTLHTNSAAGSLPRLLDMHIEPYLITSTVNVIVAQRLVRKVCEHCKEQYEASDEVVKMIHKVMNGLAGFDMYSFPKRDNRAVAPGQVSTVNPSTVPPAELAKQTPSNTKINLFRGKGCSKCENTGYSGRIGVFEVLKVSEKIAQLIMEHRSSENIERQAIDEGMITMLQDGFIKAIEGVTTIEEVLRVQKK